jgi:hypothetical protein
MFPRLLAEFRIHSKAWRRRDIEACFWLDDQSTSKVRTGHTVLVELRECSRPEQPRIFSQTQHEDSYAPHTAQGCLSTCSVIAMPQPCAYGRTIHTCPCRHIVPHSLPQTYIEHCPATSNFHGPHQSTQRPQHQQLPLRPRYHENLAWRRDSTCQLTVSGNSMVKVWIAVCNPRFRVSQYTASYAAEP